MLRLGLVVSGGSTAASKEEVSFFSIMNLHLHERIINHAS